MKGPWHIALACETREYGWGEDSMLHCEVYFLTATNPRGSRFIGPLLGNNRDSSHETVESWEKLPETFDLNGFDPETNPDWTPWFPVYGSDAYERSGQELANLDAEKTNRPYYPV